MFPGMGHLLTGSKVTASKYMGRDLQIHLVDTGGIHIDDSEGEFPLQVCAAAWIRYFPVKNRPCSLAAHSKSSRN